MMHRAKRVALIGVLMLMLGPLLGNKSCSEALNEAEQAESSSVTAEPAGGDENLPNLPDDSAESDAILKSGGPEVLSPPVESDQDAYDAEPYDGDDYEGDERAGDEYEDQEREGDAFENQERMGDRFEEQERTGDEFEWGERDAEPDPGDAPGEPEPAPDPF